MESKLFKGYKSLHKTLMVTCSTSYLFGDGFAVQLVVDFSDLGHGESRDREPIQTEGNFLLWHQCNGGGRGYLCL